MAIWVYFSFTLLGRGTYLVLNMISIFYSQFCLTIIKPHYRLLSSLAADTNGVYATTMMYYRHQTNLIKCFPHHYLTICFFAVFIAPLSYSTIFDDLLFCCFYMFICFLSKIEQKTNINRVEQ